MRYHMTFCLGVNLPSPRRCQEPFTNIVKPRYSISLWTRNEAIIPIVKLALLWPMRDAAISSDLKLKTPRREITKIDQLWGGDCSRFFLKTESEVCFWNTQVFKIFLLDLFGGLWWKNWERSFFQTSSNRSYVDCVFWNASKDVFDHAVLFRKLLCESDLFHQIFLYRRIEEL